MICSLWANCSYCFPLSIIFVFYKTTPQQKEADYNISFVAYAQIASLWVAPNPWVNAHPLGIKNFSSASFRSGSPTQTSVQSFWHQTSMLLANSVPIWKVRKTRACVVSVIEKIILFFWGQSSWFSPIEKRRRSMCEAVKEIMVRQLCQPYCTKYFMLYSKKGDVNLIENQQAFEAARKTRKSAPTENDWWSVA